MKQQVLYLFALLLVATGCVPNGISPLPTSKQSSIIKTDVVAYVPDVPEESREGSCWATFLNSPYSWSCMTGSVVHEPCLTATDGETIVCGINPLDESTHFAVNLTEPLPEPEVQERGDGPTSLTTWLIELDDNVICGLYSGTSIIINDERVNYGCTDTDESQILGNPIPSEVWTAIKITLGNNDKSLFAETEEVVSIVRVWQPGNPSVSAETGQSLTEEDLRNASYQGIYDEPVQLSDGIYEGEPFVEGGASRPMIWFIDEQTTFGDIDDDGVDEAVVHLVENSGGSGSFSYLALVEDELGVVTNTATAFIGDRIELHNLTIEAGKIVVEMTTQGPGDAFCCASQRVQFSLMPGQDGGLVEADFEILLPSVSERLKNATYHLEDIEEPIEMVDGQFQGKPYVEGGASAPGASLVDQEGGSLAGLAYYTGDLTGDEQAEAVVILAANLGGSGSFHHLAVMTLPTDGALPAQVATYPLGDRVKIGVVYLEQNEIVLTLTTHGPNDGLCCPTQETEWRFALENGVLVRTDE